VRTLVHLSDLHFGRVDPALLQPLRSRIAAIEPDVVVVSGDLTQRARRRQFKEARAFLDTLPSPQVVVPGNHDVPLYNVFGRFMAPLESYRRYIHDNPEPAHVDEEIAVLGVNTARSLTFKGGRINEEQVEILRARLCALGDDVTKVVVSHHPFDIPVHWDKDHIVGRAPMAVRILARCGADVFLAGHVHLSHAGDTSERYSITGFAALVVQAGTATSNRSRGEVNSFNALHVEPRRIAVDRHLWDAAARDFRIASKQVFERVGERWTRVTTK
jgi:3',5'-cyclic AMP phosphodiesterase CpdA